MGAGLIAAATTTAVRPVVTADPVQSGRPGLPRILGWADRQGRDTVRGVVTARSDPAQRVRIRLGGNGRRVLLTGHIVTGVGLLGSVAVVLAINIRAAATSDPVLAASSYEMLAMLTLLFGIPLSFASLISGVLLGLSSKWGVIRYGWVVTKLVLLIGVILMGALVLGPGTDSMRSGDGGAEARLITGSAYVCALLLATGLSVFKPRRKRRVGHVQKRPGVSSA